MRRWSCRSWACCTTALRARQPRAVRFPFFYSYQLAWVPVVALLTWIVYSAQLFGINAEALWGLATNLVVAVALTALLRAIGAGDSADETVEDDYEERDPSGVQPLPATPGQEPVPRPSGA